MFEAKFENEEHSFSAEFFEAMDTGEHYNFGGGLSFDTETRTLSVDCADSVTEGETKPVSSEAVRREIGNIETILKSI